MPSPEQHYDEVPDRNSQPWKQYDDLSAGERFLVNGSHYIKLNDRTCMNDRGEPVSTADILKQSTSIQPVSGDVLPAEDDGFDSHGEGNPYYLAYLQLDDGDYFTIDGMDGVFLKTSNIFCDQMDVEANGLCLSDQSDMFRAAEICTGEISLWDHNLEHLGFALDESSVPHQELHVPGWLPKNRVESYLPAQAMHVARSRSRYESLMDPTHNLN
jgi:hypothetical protein